MTMHYDAVKTFGDYFSAYLHHEEDKDKIAEAGDL